MDGTFLAANKSVPTLNLLLLDELARRGIAFVPCTGRPVMAVPEELLVHPATRYVIASNGAVVHDVTSHANLNVEAIDKGQVVALFELVRHLQVTFDVFADGAVYAQQDRYEAMGTYGIDEPTLQMLRRVRTPVELTVRELVRRVGTIDKVTCFWRDEDDRNGLEHAIASLGTFSSAHGHPKNFELQAAGVSKGFALRWLCAHLHMSPASTIAFGDETNDLPLLQAAGDGVAMANAAPEVLAAADHVTAHTNDEAGVAHYVLHLLQNGQ